MENKHIQLPLGIYSYNPDQALQLIKTKPNAFLLMALISFKKSIECGRGSELEDDEIYFSERDIRMVGYKPILSRGQLQVALKNLIIFGFIQIRKSKFSRLKIIKIIVNPFFKMVVIS